MTHLPPASLLRLKEGDIVRLCGLEAAASGLEAASRHEVRDARRSSARLEATVGLIPASRVWAEVSGDPLITALSWQCSSDSPNSAASGGAGTLGCMHVAAVLSAWIRAPSDFAVPAVVDSLEQTERAAAAPDPSPPVSPSTHAALAQPRLLTASGPRRHGADPLSLADELARLSAAEVVAAGRRVLGVESDDREVRVMLAATLSDPKRLAQLLERLEPGARLLLSDILLLGGAITAADLESRAQRTGQAPSAARFDIAILERHALVFRAAGASAGQSGAERSFRQVAGWRIPAEIRHAITSSSPLSPLAAAAAAAAAPGPPILSSAPAPFGKLQGADARYMGSVRVVRGSPRHLALALALLARAPTPYNPFAPRQERQSAPAGAKASASGRPEQSLFPLMPADLAPPALADFARGANISAGLARLARRVLFWSREGGMDSGLRDLATIPLEERHLALLAGFRVWRAAEEPAELADLNGPGMPVRVRFDTGHAALRPAALATEVAEARGFVVRLLERAQPGVWYAVDALLTLVWRLNPLFLRGRQLTYARPAWWIERVSDARPLRPTTHDEWLAAEGRYLCELLAGPLYWWGAVDLALDATRMPVAFRLTSFGAYLLGQRETAPPPFNLLLGGDWGPAVLPTRERRLAVQPFAAGSALLAALDGWAEGAAVAGGRLVYALAPDRAAAAFDSGATYDGLLRMLRSAEVGGGRAAATVESQLAAWREAHGRSRIEQGGTLIEAQDEATLAEALAYAPEIAARSRRIGPALALAAPADGAALRDILNRRGYHV